ncbi:MAG: hypothetical protein E7Z89_07030 [Cyanobacteria bacterium SIG28]|nr:hypothetical protein [Cyanobacteria bacterium SIG28]
MYPQFILDQEGARHFLDANRNIPYSEIISRFGNNGYYLQNIIMQIFMIFLSFFLVCCCFNIKIWNNFIDLTIFSNKKFVYFFINLSYPIWTFCQTFSDLADMEKHVYPSSADSMGIGLFGTIFLLMFMGMIYYPLVNFFTIITYNTKVSNFLYIICDVLAILGIVFWWIAVNVDSIFSWLLLPQYMIYLISILILVSAIRFLSRKRRVFRKKFITNSALVNTIS